MGLLFFGFGLSLLLEDLGYGLSEELMFITILPAFIIYPIIAIFITNPRKGIIQLSEKVERNKKKFISIQMIWLCLTLILGTYISLQPTNANLWNAITASLIIITGVIIIFSIPAYYFKIDRLYIYAILVALPFPIRMITKDVFFEISTTMFFITSIIILLWGIIRIKQFIQNTPQTGNI